MYANKLEPKKVEQDFVLLYLNIATEKQNDVKIEFEISFESCSN